MSSRKTARTKQPRPSPDEPNQAEINALVGLFNQGRYPNAAQHAQDMTMRYPRYGFGWALLGAVLKQTGQAVEALAAMRQAAALSPNVVEAHYNLGVTLYDLGRFDEAEACYRRAVQLAPELAEAHNNLGLTLHDLGRLDEAVACYRRALQIRPDYPEANFGLGNILKQQGRFDEAVTCYRQVLQTRPDEAEAYSNLGNTLKKLGRLDEAISCYQSALQIWPDGAEIYYNLGNTLNELGRLEEAEASYRRALEIKPGYAEGYNNQGLTLKEMGRLDEAVASYHQALEIKPDYADAYNNLGLALNGLGRLDEAEAAYRRALELKPDFAEAYSNLAGNYNDQGRLAEAEAAYRRALELKPDFADAHDNLLLVLNYDPSKSNADLHAAHQAYEVRFGAPQRAHWPRHSNSPEPERRLRIGYVSPDYRQHSVAYFLEPLLREHDHRQVEVYGYAQVPKPDAVTRRLQSHTDHWLNTVGLSDAALAQRIIADQIDLLVDLAGHTAHNRLGVFARKPAPIQISWLGYPNTTGLAAMDYRLVDAITDPIGDADRWASERLIRLEHGFLCYQAPADAPEPAEPPSRDQGYTTYGSFNNPAKLSDATLDTWAEILKRDDRARLLAKGRGFAEAAGRDRFLKRLAERGIQADRITLLGHVTDPAGHLATYDRIDIALDPFPYNGTTTTCEALWMGVPVISLKGDRHAGRVGASLLAQLGLDELVATTTEDYIALALTLGADGARLSALRRSLRERMKASPLCDAPGFARKIEAGYRELWRRYCETKEPSA